MNPRASFLARLDARDRALLGRWSLGALTPARTARAWRALTHAGGLRASVAAVVLPWVFGSAAVRDAATVAGLSLLLSHLVVQLVKRRAQRARPTASAAEATGEWHCGPHAAGGVGRAHVEIPDQFSFPSGHSCASMSVVFSYAAAFPALSVPLTLAAMLVGFSRVRLGVHYPGDVVAGQSIAMLTVVVLRWLGVAS